MVLMRFELPDWELPRPLSFTAKQDRVTASTLETVAEDMGMLP